MGYHWTDCVLLQRTAERSHWPEKRLHTDQTYKAPGPHHVGAQSNLPCLAACNTTPACDPGHLHALTRRSFAAVRDSAQRHAAYHTCAGRCTRGCLSSRTPAAHTSTLRCRTAPAARSMSWPGQMRGPAQRARGLRRQRGRSAPNTQSAVGCEPKLTQACPAGRASDWRSLRARLVVGPAVLPARRARHVRHRAPRVDYHRKLPLWRAQHERRVEVPARRAATNPSHARPELAATAPSPACRVGHQPSSRARAQACQLQASARLRRSTVPSACPAQRLPVQLSGSADDAGHH